MEFSKDGLDVVEKNAPSNHKLFEHSQHPQLLYDSVSQVKYEHMGMTDLLSRFNLDQQTRHLTLLFRSLRIFRYDLKGEYYSNQKLQRSSLC